MKRKTRLITAALSIVALSTVAGAQTTDGAIRKLSLKDAVALALSIQPNIQSAQAQANAARQGLLHAQAAFYPTVSLNYTTNDSYQSNAQAFTSTSAGVVSTTTSLTSSTRQGDVVVSYQFLDSGQRAATVLAARANMNALKYATEDERQSTVANVVNGYYTLLRRRALIKVQQSNVKHAQATFDSTQEQVRQGVLAKNEVLQAQADLENAKVTLLQADNNEATAAADLKRAIGIASGESIEPTDDPNGTDTLTSSSAKLDSLLDTAYKTRADLRQAMQNVEYEKANVRYAQAANGFTVSVDANLTSLFTPDNANSRSIGLTASLPIFNGGANKASAEQAKETRKSVEAQLQAKKVSVANEVETAYRTLQSARAALPAVEVAQRAAQANYDAAAESRKEGVGTVLDVITAQSQLVQAQINTIQALYDLYIADVTLQRAIGHADAILARIGGSK